MERQREKWNLDSLLETLPMPVGGTTTQGVIVAANREFRSLFGYGDQEYPGMGFERLMPERTIPMYRILMSAFASSTANGPMTRSRKWIGRHRNGTELALRIQLKLTESECGSLVMVCLGNGSEMDSVEERLRRKMEVRRAIFSTSRQGLLILDRLGAIQACSAAAERMTGYCERELLGRNVLRLLSGEELARRTAADRSLAAVEMNSMRGSSPGFRTFAATACPGHPSVRNWTLAPKNGGELEVQVSLAALPQRDGVGVFGYLAAIANLAEWQDGNAEILTLLQEAKQWRQFAQVVLQRKSEAVSAYVHRQQNG